MSKVYSFRLDENNHREAQAREVINAWVREGYILRYIITEALISLGKNNSRNNDHEKSLERIIDLLEALTHGDFKPDPGEENILSKLFVGSIEQVLKPGLRLKDQALPPSQS